MTATTPLAALTALVVDNPDLDRLEALLGEFNLFHALGIARQEVRHSAFLAFLLDPSQGHGLGDAFLRRFLQRALSGGAGGSGRVRGALSPVEVDVLPFADVDVRREHANIDVFVVDPTSRIAVIVENKIDSGEHGNQLARYWKHVELELPGHRLVGVFLTPDGDAPSDARYHALGYGEIADILQGLLAAKAARLGPDVATVLRHYERLLRRSIVSESDIARLCRQIYRKHKEALDLIFEHRPDPYSGPVRDELVRSIERHPALVQDGSVKTYLRIGYQPWDTPKLTQGEGWTKSGRMLLFEVTFAADRVFLKLTLGPGPADVRQAVFEAARANPAAFPGNQKTLSPTYHQLFQRPLLDEAQLAGDDDAMVATVRKGWAVFVDQELPAIAAALAPVAPVTGP